MYTIDGTRGLICARLPIKAVVNRVAVLGSELVIGGRFAFARPFIEFVPLYRPRGPATFQIALHNPLPKLIRRGGEVVQFHPRADLPSSIPKGIPLFPGPNAPFNHHVLSSAQEAER